MTVRIKKQSGNDTFIKLSFQSTLLLSEFRSCVKVKVAVLVPNSPDGLCGRKATFEEEDDQIK